MSDRPDWMEQARRLVSGLGQSLGAAARPAEGAAAGGSAGHAADCRWCPLCQAAAVLRGERPEVTAALADTLAAVAGALRTYGAAAEPAGPAPDQPAPDADPGPPVQHVEIA